MLNIDDRFITETMPKIGAKATAVLLAICKHSGVKNTAFPSRKTLQKYTGLGRDAVDREIKLLVDAGLISKEQRRSGDGKKMSTNLYKIKIKYIKVYIESKQIFTENVVTESQVTESQVTESQVTESQVTESQYAISINKVIEVLTNKYLSINKILEADVVVKKGLTAEDVFKIQIENDVEFLTMLVKNLKIQKSEIFEFGEIFISEKIGLGEVHKNFGEAKRNFYFWLKKQDLKKRKKVAPKKEKSQLVNAWTDTYEQLTGSPYVFDAAGKREAELAGLENTLIKAMQAKQSRSNFSTEEVELGLQHLMSRAYQNNWIKERFSINILSLKFNEIISGQFSGKMNLQDELAKAREEAEKMYG